MSHKPLNLITGSLFIVIGAALCACHSDKAPGQSASLMAAPAQPTAPVVSYVGTVPVLSADQQMVTPMETVGATPN